MSTEPNGIKVNLFTKDMKPLGGFRSPAVPREGEGLNWEGELYNVWTVVWEGLPDNPTVQVRVEDDD